MMIPRWSLLAPSCTPSFQHTQWWFFINLTALVMPRDRSVGSLATYFHLFIERVHFATPRTFDNYCILPHTDVVDNKKGGGRQNVLVNNGGLTLHWWRNYWSGCQNYLRIQAVVLTSTSPVLWIPALHGLPSIVLYCYTCVHLLPFPGSWWFSVVIFGHRKEVYHNIIQKCCML